MSDTPPTPTATINGKEYALADLSEAAKQQIVNIRVTDTEIERLNQQLAIARTARSAYIKALEEALPKDDE